MDPLSVLSIAGVAGATAKAAWNVGVGIHTFFTAVGTVDQTVNGLVTEVKSLSSACNFVDQRLRDIVQDYDAEVRKPRADEGKIWACINAQVLESQQSVEQLEAAFQKVQKERTTKLAQVWRQISINIQARDIDEARNRLRSHTASLQTILQTVAIEVCYLAPQRADQQLRTLLSAVDECKTQLRALRQERPERSEETHANEIEILKVCEDAISNGESLYAASVKGGNLPRFSGPPGAVGNIQQWMADLSAIEETVAGPSVNDRESNSAVTARESSVTRIEEGSQPKESRASTTVVEHDDGHLSGQQNGDEELDSDDEFPVELAQEALNAARSSFDCADYLEADSYLREAVKMVRKLPAKRQSMCDTWDVRYMLSVCAYHSQRPADAEAKLLSVIENSSRSSTASDEQHRQVCEAGHLLSQLYIKIGNLDLAYLYCNNALKGRRRLLGKSHDDTYQSLALIARIYQLQDEHTQAKIHLRLINEDKRLELEHAYSELAFTAAISDAYDSARRESLPDSTTTLPQQIEKEDCELKTLASAESTASVEEKPLKGLESGLSKLMRPPESLSERTTTSRKISTFSTSSVLSDDTHAVSTPLSSTSNQSLQASAPTIVIGTAFGEVSVAVKTNLRKYSSKFNPLAWKDFNSEVHSGRYSDAVLCRQEKVKGGRFKTVIEGSSAQDLKISILPSTFDFVLEQKKTRVLRVEGTVVAGKDVITRIMMFRPGIRRGGSVEIINWQIPEVA